MLVLCEFSLIDLSHTAVELSLVSELSSMV